MERETWTHEELFRGLDPSPAFVTELEGLGLLPLVARDSKGISIYAAEAQEQLKKVMALVELGYQPKDIAAIARKVGLPQGKRRRFRKPPIYMRLEALGAQSGVALEELEAWCKRGILRPTTQTESGTPLFTADTVEVVRALRDLLAFGLNQDQLSEWSQLGRAVDKLITELHMTAGSAEAESLTDVQEQVNRAAEMIGALRKRLDALRGGLRRWDKLIGAYDKRLDRLRRVWHLEGRKTRGRRRVRVPTRRRLL